MLTCRLLGGVDFAGGRGEEFDQLAAGAKRVGLIAFLALARPRGLQRRDTAALMLWGELDQARARAALRNTLHQLRRALGPQAFVARGDEELGLAPDALSIDVVEFERLADAGMLAEALAWYRGDLLPAFHVPGCVEFERFLDTERMRLNARALAVALQLARAREDVGDLVGAVAAARRARELSPESEPAVRRVMELLSRQGDAAGALAEHERFAALMRAEYESEPSAETRQLAERIRSGEHGGAVARVRRDIVEPPAPAAPVPAGARARPSSGRWAWALGATSVVAMFALVAAFVRASSNATPRAEAAPSVAVFPFDVRGSEELRYLREGMIDLLGVKLDGVRGLRGTSSHALRRAAGGAFERPLDTREASLIARRAGAAYFILGTVTAAGGELALTATAFDSSGRVQRTAATARGDASRVFDLADDLARQLVAGLYEGSTRDPVALAPAGTTSLAALRRYLDGEQALRSGRPLVAAEAFREAIDEDSAFALAHYRLAVAHSWMANHEEARAAALAADRMTDRLPSSTRRLVKASLALWSGDYARAESLFSVAVSSRPDDGEAWFGLGDALYHANAARGRSKGEAVGPLARAAAMTPGHAEAVVHLLDLYAWEGRVREVDSLLPQLDPASDFALKWPMLRAMLTLDDEALDSILPTLAALDDRTLVRTVVHSGPAMVHAPDHSLRAIALLTDEARAVEWRAYAHYLRAQVLASRGRWREAHAALEQLRALEPTAGFVHLGLQATVPGQAVDRAGLLAVRDLLRSWDPAAHPPSSTRRFVKLDSARHEHRDYLLGRVALALGDPAGLAESEQALRGRDTPIGAVFLRSLRARRALAAGEGTQALQELGPATPAVASSGHAPGLMESLTAEKFLRGEILAAAGRADEAVSALESTTEYSMEGLPYVPASVEQRAALAERTGRTEEARRLYARFVGAWAAADEPGRKRWLEATQRLKSLEERRRR